MRPSKTSKAFWEAMTKVQSHLTDVKKIAVYNQRKEQKLKVRRSNWADTLFGRRSSFMDGVVGGWL